MNSILHDILLWQWIQNIH